MQLTSFISLIFVVSYNITIFFLKSNLFVILNQLYTMIDIHPYISVTHTCVDGQASYVE